MDFTRPARSQPERTGREDRRLKFYEPRDNLARTRQRRFARATSSRYAGFSSRVSARALTIEKRVLSSLPNATPAEDVPLVVELRDGGPV
jgi:hypothetical protein